MVSKARTALRELERKDFVLMNIKASDVVSHDGDPRRKIEVIERLDSMAKVLRDGLTRGGGDRLLRRPLHSGGANRSFR